MFSENYFVHNNAFKDGATLEIQKYVMQLIIAKNKRKEEILFYEVYISNALWSI